VKNELLYKLFVDFLRNEVNIDNHIEVAGMEMVA
jgi:hypothetical protein